MTLLPPTTSADCAPVRAGSDAGGVGQGTLVVPAGACADVLQAVPSELLPVAVARLVFCRMLAPGLIVTLRATFCELQASRSRVSVGRTLPRASLPLYNRPLTF